MRGSSTFATDSTSCVNATCFTCVEVYLNVSCYQIYIFPVILVLIIYRGRPFEKTLRQVFRSRLIFESSSFKMIKSK